MKTDYAAHDARYRELRGRGGVGWDDPGEYRAREAMITWALERFTPAGQRLLELGCGAGNMAPFLAQRGFLVDGIDISETAVAWANERALPTARFFVGNIVTAIPGAYDVIVDGHCLHCIIGDDRARLLANVRGALAPGGRFIVATMCGAITIPALRACYDPATRCQIVNGVAYRYIGEASDIKGELRAAGFAVDAWTIRERESDDDQDDLWAVTRSA